MAEPNLLAMRQAIVDGDVDEARRLASALVESSADVLSALENGFIAGIRRVGELWDEGEYFLPELVQGAEAMKAAMAIVQPALVGLASAPRARGRVVIGTVEGDLHDIGKSLVGVLLAANGFEVHDLGTNVPIEAFLFKAEQVDADIIGASALLTTTMEVQEQLVAAVRATPAHDRRHVILGGAPTSRQWAERLGVIHAENALQAVAIAEELMR